MTGQQLLDTALTHVDSPTVRQWVNTENNRPIWLTIADRAVAKGAPSDDAHRFAAYIVAVWLDGPSK